MFSITSIIFAVGFISFTSGLVKERRSAFEAALKCTKAGWDANVAALESGSGGSGGGLVEMVEDACIFFRVTYRTLIIATFNFATRFSTLLAILLVTEKDFVFVISKSFTE